VGWVVEKKKEMSCGLGGSGNGVMKGGQRNERCAGGD